MPKQRRDLKAEILQAGIELFGLHGLGGTTTRMVAATAHTHAPLLHNSFETKDNLHAKAVEAVVGHANQAFTEFVGKVFGASSGDPTASRLLDAVVSWYNAIPRPSARLLLQVMISEHELDKDVRAALDQFANVLARVAMELQPATHERQKKGSRKLNPQLAARALVRSLLLQKVLEPKTAEQELEDTVQQWLSKSAA